MSEESKQEAQRTEAPPVAEAEDAAGRERELAEARRRGEELYARLQYLQADFENFRKRTEREMEMLVRNANEALVSRLLPFLDDLDAAGASLRGKAGKGLVMLRDNLLRTLREAGLEEIPAMGAAFDPYLHECVQQVNDPDAPDGTVKDVVRKGYRFQTRVARPAQVVVVKKEGPSTEPKDGEQHA
ncbi:MAG TPA: nucleotide exchange factor GrpE [Thermoplasmata archaeon]|nr:nucleotide exchange factor GrpE [Thermoplasmata archaeon]HLE46054.1 nucleotide exchange factor GrpE [Thermoplasmata archaeon]